MLRLRISEQGPRTRSNRGRSSFTHFKRPRATTVAARGRFISRAISPTATGEHEQIKTNVPKSQRNYPAVFQAAVEYPVINCYIIPQTPPWAHTSSPYLWSKNRSICTRQGISSMFHGSSIEVLSSIEDYLKVFTSDYNRIIAFFFANIYKLFQAKATYRPCNF